MELKTYRASVRNLIDLQRDREWLERVIAGSSLAQRYKDVIREELDRG